LNEKGNHFHTAVESSFAIVAQSLSANSIKVNRKKQALQEAIQQLKKQNQKFESMFPIETKRNTEAHSETDFARETFEKRKRKAVQVNATIEECQRILGVAG
jgi:hypothetical protein